ncbi:hypothetical protein KPL71_023729 [Citrus sinensis]|uniref:Uncharacterized protein n=1 Tax=Citrus sinensis TaxID=2711 RepID=A0ACB8IN27_CITSI|nr:hypothetical protein KPL71_023729 [Citrus sinensis]
MMMMMMKHQPRSCKPVRSSAGLLPTPPMVSCMMFSYASDSASDYSSEYPPLEKRSDQKHQNARVQNASLTSLHSKVDQIAHRSSAVETRVTSLSNQLTNLYNSLHTKVAQLDRDLRAMIARVHTAPPSYFPTEPYHPLGSFFPTTPRDYTPERVFPMTYHLNPQPAKPKPRPPRHPVPPPTVSIPPPVRPMYSDAIQKPLQIHEPVFPDLPSTSALPPFPESPSKAEQKKPAENYLITAPELDQLNSSSEESSPSDSVETFDSITETSEPNSFSSDDSQQHLTDISRLLMADHAKSTTTDKEGFRTACKKPYLEIQCKDSKHCTCPSTKKHHKVRFHKKSSRTPQSRPFPRYPKNPKRSQRLVQQLQSLHQFSPDTDQIEFLYSEEESPDPDTVFALGTSDSDSDSTSSTDQKTIPLSSTSDTGTQRSILNPAILPPETWISNENHFRAASGKLFSTKLHTKSRIGIQLFPKLTVWTHVIGSSLPDKDLLLGFDILFQAQKIQVLPTGLRFQSMFQPFTDQLKLYHLAQSPPDYQSISAQLLRFCPPNHLAFAHPHPLWKNPAHLVKLPFKLNEDLNPTKATHPGMPPSELQLAQTECAELLAQGCPQLLRGPAKPFMLINVLKRYGLGIDPAERYKTAFCIPNAHYQWTVLPFGTPEEHQVLLQQFHDIVDQYGIMLSDKKSTIATDTVEYLGMQIKNGFYQPGPHIAQELLHFPDKDFTKNQVQQFLGIINYIRESAQISESSYPLLSPYHLYKRPSPAVFVLSYPHAIYEMEDHQIFAMFGNPFEFFSGFAMFGNPFEFFSVDGRRESFSFMASTSSSNPSTSVTLSSTLSLPKSCTSHTANKIENLVQYSYIPESAQISESSYPLLSPYHLYKRPSSFTRSIRTLISTRRPHPKEYIQSSRLDQCSLQATPAEQYVTLEIPLELISNWKREGYTHLHLGGIRLILTLHGRKGLPVTARLTMLDTRFKQYQDAVIGTVLTTLHAGSVLLTFYPNFNLSLQDPNLPTTLKVQIQIQGAEQISSAKIATLHHQLVYRLQNHALDLPTPEHHSDTLMVLAESDQIPTIIQIPRQIPRHELIKLMPLEWISNYEQFHNNTAPIQTSESMFERRQDGTVRMTFKPPPSAPQEPPRLSFTYSSMITAVQTGQEDLPITGFNSEGYPVYPTKHNGHFLWDAPGSGMCDPNCPCWDDWEEDDDYATTRKKKPKKKKPPVACHHCDPKPPSDPPPPPAPLPIYRKELKWIAKNYKSEIPSPLSHSTPIVQPLACMMFSSTSSDYSSSFPSLEPHTDPQQNVVSKPFIPSPITSTGHLEPPKPFESVLNWQTQNARAQNDTLLHLNSKVENISLRTEQIETKVDSITAQMQQIYQNLQSKISQLDSELRAMLAHRYSGPEFDQKEREIRRLKAELAQIESEKQRPTLFTTSPPIPSIGPTYHPFASMLSPIKQYDPSKLFGMTHTLFRDNPLPPPPKPKPKPRPQPRPAPLHPSSLTIPGQPSPSSTPASPLAPLSVPTKSKDKEPMHQFTAHTVTHSSTTVDQTSDSNPAVSDSPTETDTESSVSTSDSEKSYADITKILMAQPDKPTQGQTSHTEPYVDIPSEVEEEMPESSATNQPPPTQTNPSSQKSSNGPWFTFDDLPSHKWRDRLNEMSAWIDLQMLRPGATTQSVLREFATRFTGALRDWFDSLGQYRQLQFVDLPEVSSALAVLHDQFLGDPSAVFEAARRDYLNMKCCSLNAKDLDFHYKRMSLLFYKLNGFNEPTLKHVFLASLPEELQPNIQRQLTASNLSLDNISLGKIFQLAKTCLDKLCEQKQFFKELLKDKEPFRSACKKPYLQIKCHKKKGCDCSSKKKRHFRKFKTPEFSSKPRRSRKPYRFFRKKSSSSREFKRKQSSRCFICKRKGHYAKDCPNKREKSIRLVEHLQATTDYSPAKDELEFYFSEQDEPNEETVFALQNSSDSDSDQSQVIFHQQSLSLDTTVPIPSIKLQILPSIFQRPIPAIGLIDTGAQRSMLNPHILPSEYWTQSEEHFKAVNGKLFTTSLITKKPIGSHDEHRQLLTQFYDILQSHGIMLSAKKSIIATDNVEFLGMIIKDGHYQPGKHIAQELLHFPDQQLSKRQIQQFLGIINYIRDFIPHVDHYTHHLSALLKKKPPEWNADHTFAVTTLKQIAQNPPPLKLITDGKRILQTDASDESWGAILLEEINGKEHFIAYASGHFSDTQKHYHSVFKEILAVKNGIKKFEYHLIGHHFLIRMDSSAFPNIFHFKGKTVPEKLLLRLKDWFSKYDFSVKHIKGSQNLIPDMLSRLSKPENPLTLFSTTYHFPIISMATSLPPEALTKKTFPFNKTFSSVFAIQEFARKALFRFFMKAYLVTDPFPFSTFHPENLFLTGLTLDPTRDTTEDVLWYVWCLTVLYATKLILPISPTLEHLLDPDKATSLTWTLLEWFSPIPWWRKKLQQLSEIHNLDRVPAPEAQMFTSVFIIHRPYFQHPDTKLFWTQDQVYEWFTAPHIAVIENDIQDVLHNYLCQLNHQPPPLKDISHTSLGPQHDLLMIPTPSAISKPKSTSIIIKEEKPDYTDFLFQDSQDPWDAFLPLSQHLHQFPQPTMDEPGPSEPGPSTQSSKRPAQPSKVDKATQTSPQYTPKCTPRDYNCPYPPCRGPSCKHPKLSKTFFPKSNPDNPYETESSSEDEYMNLRSP